MAREEFADQPIAEETQCGIWFFKGAYLQRFATKKVYVFLYGLLGCVFSASYAYFNGTISTMEKRFKISSKTTGIITVGNDISQLLVSAQLSYYAGKGHRPRWIAVGMYIVSLFCLLNVLPHVIYGPGQDALSLTKEFGQSEDINSTSIGDQSTLCRDESSCDDSEKGYIPALILFFAQFISGVGGSLYYTLGASYMDDNIRKSKTPALISFSYFIRMLGPALGYGLSSICLNLYIAPTLSPTIKNDNPRWLGAWWLGWLILAVVMFIASTLIGLFPKMLPRAALRRQKASETKLIEHKEDRPSFRDMMKTFRRLIMNKTLMCNTFAAIFYFMGYMPYWIFLPKYIQTMFKTSASYSSMIVGTVGLVFSAVGILLSGIFITLKQPRARPLAAWNVLVGAISVIGMISYAFLGCTNPNEASLVPTLNDTECNANCDCTFVKYSPVCAGDQDFISPCHAGCTMRQKINETTYLTNCSCSKDFITQFEDKYGGVATPGPCPLNCTIPLYIFLAIMCTLKFFGATGRASNFLVSVRCVEEKDKPIAMGFGLMLMSLFAFIPSPILFGYIIDTTCVVWGKTCDGGIGNCWKYDGESLRYVVNFLAATFVTIGTAFDLGVWYYVKDLEIFDNDEDELNDMKQAETNAEEIKQEKHAESNGLNKLN